MGAMASILKGVTTNQGDRKYLGRRTRDARNGRRRFVGNDRRSCSHLIALRNKWMQLFTCHQRARHMSSAFVTCHERSPHFISARHGSDTSSTVSTSRHHHHRLVAASHCPCLSTPCLPVAEYEHETSLLIRAAHAQCCSSSPTSQKPPAHKRGTSAYAH